jgi:hypothetical protein
MQTPKSYFFCMILLVSTGLQAQTDGYFIFPQPIASGKYTSTVGLLAAGLPEDQVEEASTAIRSPLLNYQALYALPSNFQLYGGFYTNLITYHFSLGPKWGFRFDRFTGAIGYDVAYWFGQLEQYGFQSKIHGWLHYPNLTCGYDFGHFAISIKGELILLSSLTEKQDDIEISNNQNSFGGGTVAVYIEQPLWKDNYMLIGLKANFTKFYYPTWAAFATFNRYLFIPEIVLGINL